MAGFEGEGAPDQMMGAPKTVDIPVEQQVQNMNSAMSSAPQFSQYGQAAKAAMLTNALNRPYERQKLADKHAEEQRQGTRTVEMLKQLYPDKMEPPSMLTGREDGVGSPEQVGFTGDPQARLADIQRIPAGPDREAALAQFQTQMQPTRTGGIPKYAQLMAAGGADAKTIGAALATDARQENRQNFTINNVQPFQEKMQGDRQAFTAGENEKKVASQKEIAGMRGRLGGAGMDQASTDLLASAVEGGRLDPYKVNSRTGPIFAAMLSTNPNMDLNRVASNAALARNPAFRQKGMTLEALPEMMNNMVDAGKKLDFSDVRAIGNMQAWVNGQFNDPNYQEYMTLRNDALMQIAFAMRGVGMTDQAHRAEIEVASPSMPPDALDAWLKGQMKSLAPRINMVKEVTGGGTIKNPESSNFPKTTAETAEFSGKTYRLKPGADRKLKSSWEPL